jgi:hypothetical protein
VVIQFATKEKISWFGKKGRKLHIDFLNRFKKSRSKNTLKRGLFFKPKKGQ